jgi:hypothetical protein
MHRQTLPEDTMMKLAVTAQLARLDSSHLAAVTLLLHHMLHCAS